MYFFENLTIRVFLIISFLLQRLACADEDFMCQSGLCIPHNYVCNAINDCPNSEDENLLMCKV